MDDMMMMHGTPWFDSPITLDGSREYECEFNTTWQCEYQTGYWHFWYEADHRYALPTVAFFMTAIILFAIGFILTEFTPKSTMRSRPVRRVMARLRWLSYRSWRINALNWNSAPLGILLLGGAGLIYFLSMTLGPKPYYWPNYNGSEPSYGSSMPIATRSGWLATGCLPFVIMTAGKSNLISMVTGVSHEKLQVFHRWISYAMFVLALIHTFPFIVYHIRIGDMVEQWDTSIFYWTGVVALLAQAWLTFASFGPLRNFCYEWFKFSHFLAALIFCLFFFFHCDWTLTSAQYFVVTVVLFAASWLHRQLRIYLQYGVNHRATLSIAANGFIRVSVPTQARWKAGQHFFVRFMSLGLHAFTIHPFTACSLPSRTSGAESELVFYIRPQGGFTAKLARYVEAHPESQMRVILDGPYGGIDMQKLAACDRSVVIAGGSGAGWILPLIAAFLRRLQTQTVEKQSNLSLRVILATRDLATQTWFEKAVAQELAACPVDTLAGANLSVEMYYTGSSQNAEAPKLTGQFLQKLNDPEKGPEISAPEVSETSKSDSEGSPKPAGRPKCIQHEVNRPNLPLIIAKENEVQANERTLGVFTCGPLSMQNDVANAVAKRQLHIVKEGGSKEIYLHMEHFSWA
ncbi:hypothetical protein M409DRAFT_63939 [Zasmidium cellare ATCC 36951]|uniref:ferric-chelate reductase (NADPH) n=1 Tax=Zasmidium cellare ATCC 36951 TaxID=1080233 RepID=A0A6A6CUS4_ZASCE|nr:uncharacterized protein M409DRAFT_63939 [Zasmidium cellare ATCC 36951]KAF2170914.1 hypothetical protein M409DRAFT_63939 [Zasmidium cellare ATCC 36951]